MKSREAPWNDSSQKKRWRKVDGGAKERKKEPTFLHFFRGPRKTCVVWSPKKRIRTRSAAWFTISHPFFSLLLWHARLWCGDWDKKYHGYCFLTKSPRTESFHDEAFSRTKGLEAWRKRGRKKPHRLSRDFCFGERDERGINYKVARLYAGMEGKKHRPLCVVLVVVWCFSKNSSIT